MCGVTGFLSFTNKKASPIIKKSLKYLQHRGYDGSGVAVLNNNEIQCKRNNGKIDNSITQIDGDDMKGSIGVGQVRYKTFGSLDHKQPIVSKDRNMVLVHNGQVEADGYELDSQLILDCLTDKSVLTLGITDRILKIFKTVKGSYSCILLLPDFGLIAFRSPMGIRPLLYGKDDSGDILIASEDVSLKMMGFTEGIQNVQPGEIKMFKLDGDEYTFYIKSELRPCIFEYIYLASPESTLDDISVTEARRLFGRLLADSIRQSGVKIDMVIPIPNSSCLAAESLANKLGLEYCNVIKIKDKASRTFILPTQEKRRKAVEEKFLIDTESVRGKNILLVDDSVVRGTTLKYVVKEMRKGGANKVYVASTSPPVRHKNIYGIDIPCDKNLIANGRDIPEIASLLGCEQIFYQDLELMKKELRKMNPLIDGFECSLFTGDYA